LQVFPNLIQGWLRKHESKSKYLKTRIFPLRYVQFERRTKTLKIWVVVVSNNGKKDWSLKREFHEDIEHVKYLNPLTEQDLIFTDGLQTVFYDYNFCINTS